MNQYNHKEIEEKAKTIWRKLMIEKLYQADEKSDKAKKYILDMFPYPSADGLHTGHVESYTATDIISRFLRMRGNNVLHPQGFDAFGLPAENFAIKTRTHPSVTTQHAIKNFREQMEKMGLSYDWSRLVDTSNPDYYKWTQWFFLLLYNNGWAYKAKAKVNWCENCQTVLANEQAEGGICERCQNPVRQKELEQWFFKITDFLEPSFAPQSGASADAHALADKTEGKGRITSGLLDGLEKIDWPDSTKMAQRNWIGKSIGAQFRLAVIPRQEAEESRVNFSSEGDSLFLEVFTTRLDTIFGCTFCIIAPEHPLLEKLEPKIENWAEVKKYIEEAKSKSELQRISEMGEKTGIELKGIKIANPFNRKEIPLFTSDFVLAHYGTGAVMAVPGHDKRDYRFAQKHNLPIVEVIKSSDNKSSIEEDAFIDDGILINSEQYNGLTSEQAREKMVDWLEAKNIGHKTVNYKIRDWLISRQRYWGAPIPIIYCDECAKRKEKIMILHGWEDDSQSGFIPSLQENLEKKGFDVIAFNLPNTNKPDFNEWFDFAEKKIKEEKGKDFHLIGHSMGGHLALKLAEKFKVKDLLLVSPVGFNPGKKYFDQFTGKLSAKELEIFKKFQKRDLDIKAVKNNAKKVTFVFGKKDPWITQAVRDYYINNFHDVARFEILEKYGHISKDEGVKRVEFLENLFPTSHPGMMPVPEQDLPVILPDDVDFMPTGQSPLVHSQKFHNVKCPQCGAKARRESDTMDTFVCSSWYYFRYSDPHNKKEFAGKEQIKKWLPVDLYIGGAEHSVLHLLYSRFFTKILHKLGHIDFDEPFLKLRHQGIILAEDGRKMSKSFGNVINPDDIVAQYGADALRMFEMFMGPLDDMKQWNTRGIAGVYRFLEDTWKYLFFDYLGTFIDDADRKKWINGEQIIKTSRDIETLLHKTIKKVTSDIENFKFNTAISQLMIFRNSLFKFEIEEIQPILTRSNIETIRGRRINKSDFEKFIILLSPFAPYICEVIWKELGHDKSIFIESWPKYDEALAKDETIELVIQVNGKWRAAIKIRTDIEEEEAKKLALENEKIKKWTEGKEIVKVIFVKGKLVNIVIK